MPTDTSQSPTPRAGGTPRAAPLAGPRPSPMLPPGSNLAMIWELLRSRLGGRANPPGLPPQATPGQPPSMPPAMPPGMPPMARPQMASPTGPQGSPPPWAMSNPGMTPGAVTGMDRRAMTPAGPKPEGRTAPLPPPDRRNRPAPRAPAASGFRGQGLGPAGFTNEFNRSR